MEEDKKSFSLSYYLDELNKRKMQSVTALSKGAASPNTVLSLSILKCLKEVEGHSISLTALARKTGMKIGPCQDVCEQLMDEKLVSIVPDLETGNDTITLIEKGKGVV